MSCHYSCQSCSNNSFLNYCISCPSTRHLQGSSCACNTGFYEYQKTNCVTQSNLLGWQIVFLQISDILFYIAIAFFWIVAFLNMNRIFSTKVKRLIDTGQLVSLILYYRHSHTEVTQRALKVLSAFNFAYLNQIVCTPSGPPQDCQLYQNIIGPAIALACFLFLYFLCFIIVLCWLKVEHRTYFPKTFWGILYIYMDFTIVGNTLALMKLVNASLWAFFILVPFIFLLIVMLRKHYIIINNQKQTNLAYRYSNSFLYSYDQFYHLNYIDFLYDVQENLKEMKKKRKGKKLNNQNSSNEIQFGNQKSDMANQKSRNTVTLVRINQSKYVKGSKFLTSISSEKNDRWITEENSEIPQYVRFFPRSNFLLFELMYKCATAASIILLYDYKPSFFGYTLVIALIFQFFNLEVFFYYEKLDLIFYLVMVLVYLVNISCYPIVYYDFIAFGSASAIIILLGVYLILMLISGYQTRRVHQKIYEQVQLQQSQKNDNASFGSDLQGQYNEDVSSDETVIGIKKSKKSQSKLEQPNLVKEKVNTLANSNRVSNSFSNRNGKQPAAPSQTQKEIHQANQIQLIKFTHNQNDGAQQNVFEKKDASSQGYKSLRSRNLSNLQSRQAKLEQRQKFDNKNIDP